MHFAEYVALGDSMSMDLYPALDLGATDVAVALEREAGAGEVAPVGAASLLWRNDETHWPEETGDDLETRFPGIGFANHASAGATVGEVFGTQLPMLGESDAPTLVTLTVGAEDLFSALANRPAPKLLERFVRDVLEAYELLLTAIRAARPASVVVATTLFDPSDGTRSVPGALDGPVPLEALQQMNAGIAQLAEAHVHTVLADVHAHFHGHGVTAPDDERWYWRRSLMEPNARGASEIRRVWRDALVPIIGS